MNRTVTTRARLLGTTVLAGVGLLLSAMPASAQEAMETVTVTGYRASLADSTNAKRASVGFGDTVFAEDIGKFPDSNIAESLNRIPGITISREIDGEGVNVSIRGLGTNFTKILVNNSAVAVASTGATDSSNNNREVDLNMFPSELFTQLAVSKSVSASQLEGGAAGVINMRSQRPFDNPGLHVTYNIQGQDQFQDGAIGKRGTLIVSDTEGPFGVLIGISGVQNNVMVKGWEDGNGGWVGAGPFNNSNAANGPVLNQCAGITCNQLGGGTWPIAGFIPQGVNVQIPGSPVGTFYPQATFASNPAAPFADGTLLTPAVLYALNPGLAAAGCSLTAPTATCINTSMSRLSNALLPRLGRSMFEKGTRDRYNAVLSLEYRPTDSVHFYFDGIFGRTFNNLNRSDLDAGFRNGAGAQPMIPEGVTIDPAMLQASNFYTAGNGGVVQTATLHDAQFFLEARPYQEKGDFFSVNPGMSWDVTDLFHVDLQANASRSHFFRDSPTVFLVTCPSVPVPAGVTGCTPPAGGVNLMFDNRTGNFPNITSNLDLNSPASYQWSNSLLNGNAGRVNLQDERRYTTTSGAHLDLKYGGDELAIKVGGAYDQVFRNITAIDASQGWQNVICGDSPSVFVAGASGPPCQGIVSANPNAAEPSSGASPAWAGQGGGAVYPLWPGLGQAGGFTAGMSNVVTWQGSLVPQSQLASYLVKGPTGFVTVNYDAIKKASGYYTIDNLAINAMKGIGGPGSVASFPYSTASNLGSTSGSFDEKNWGLYANIVGQLHPGSRSLKYDIGLRWVETHQTIYSPTQDTSIAVINASLSDGGKFPNKFTFPGTKHTYQAFLPSINLVYEVADDFVVRGSISRTMTRAFPGSMISVLNYSSPTADTASLGNPALKPFFSNNIDVGAEYYTGGEGYIGVALFRKSISGFTGSQNLTVPVSFLGGFGVTWGGLTDTQRANLGAKGCTDVPSCTANVVLTTQVNQPGLEIINGMEWDYVQPLDFLLESYGLKGFGFQGNVTILDASSTATPAVHPTGVANLQYNLTGYYENNGLMIRGSYNWNGKVYATGSNQQGVCLPPGTSSGGCPAGAYLYGLPYGQFDVSSSLKLSTLFGDLPSDPEVTFDVQNLTNSKQRSIDQFGNAIHNYYIKGQTIMFGIRGTF